MNKYLAGLATAGLICVGMATAPLTMASGPGPFIEGCGQWPEPPCRPDAPRPASRSNPNGTPYWWDDNAGRHQCPPECLTE